VTTANDLITRAFRRGRVIGKDEVPAADEAADALSELNDCSTRGGSTSWRSFAS
jgi:hypothetical protein